MYKCTPKEIIKEVPNVQSVILPRNWFDDLDKNMSAFTSLYVWMIDTGLVPSENKDSLHNRTYVGEKLFKKFLTAEKKRLRKKIGNNRNELDRAVSWSDMNTGPRTEIGNCRISGDVILVIPESSRQSFSEFATKIYRKKRDGLINKIKNNAAGATYYQWLLPQVDRPDCIGDIARTVVNDAQFPRKNIYFEEIKSYLSSTSIHGVPVECVEKSWLEYSQKYPERIQAGAWCTECGSKLDIKKAFLAWSLDSNELFILDKGCIDYFNEFTQLHARPLEGITQSELEKMVKLEEVSEYEIEKMIGQLKLWGILAVNSKKKDESKNKRKNFTRRSISNSKRYEIMRRDNFQCVLCGASGSEGRLEIDHIIPVSKGGSDDKDNLRCLCFKCNRGKHAKIE